MREYNADLIRNVGVVGHGHVGKTSLLESLLYTSGVITKMGSVSHGNTVSDHDPEEINRQISIHSTVIPIEWKEYKFNIIDTPGYADFIGEAISSLKVVDAAVFVFDSLNGYGAGSERLWKIADGYGLPKIVFVNKMDKDRADFGAVLDKIRAKFGKTLVPLQLEIGSPYRDMLIEAAADIEESLLEKYIEGKEISEQEISLALKKGVLLGKIIPVLAGSALTGAGVPLLLSAIADLLPSPLSSAVSGIDPANNQEIKINPSAAEPLSAYVFKSVIEPHVGELSFVRVYSGSLNHSTSVQNASRGSQERIGQIVFSRGKQRQEVQKVNAGDIAVLPKLKNTRAGDTLCDSIRPVKFKQSQFPETAVSIAVRPKSKADQEKMGLGFSNFMKEDYTFKMHYDPETKEVIVSGMGDLQLEIILNKLKSRYGIEIETSEPRIAYKETIRGKSTAQGKYKKQTGGHGQYGDAWLKLEPLERGTGFEFVNNIVGGAIPRNYIPSVEKGVREAMEGGVIAGYPVVDLRVILFDGSYHEVDSSDLAFKIAASMGFKKAFADAKPTILEPIVDIEVNIPDEFVGNVVSDLNKRRGRIVNIEEEKVIGQVPQAEISRYAADLRSFTHGSGVFLTKFSHYEEVLPEIQEKLCALFQKEKEAGSGSAR